MSPNPDAEDLIALIARRPRVRGECGEERPCPWASCKYHLYLDVNPKTGTIKVNFPSLEPWELEESCALDVADRGGAILKEVGQAFSLTRERVRQIEKKAKEYVRPYLRRFLDAEDVELSHAVQGDEGSFAFVPNGRGSYSLGREES